ncbi:hypothetical protein [Parasitella parasitica]|uniref:Zn(2)-C6 fungal-type domain-containing protein n=1 Tax=Parasitella parasitica TaxID=35722 RepID=A0A0B7MTR0_9FUNG|nr:hypothetical protein [Parasitella parasitica]
MDSALNNKSRSSSISNDNNSAIATTIKKKSSRACAPCRKRKVKCNGLLPCDRCSRTDATCVYDKPQQKKDAPKPTADSHEPRLRALEKILRQISNLLEISDPNPPLYSNANQINIPPAPHKLFVHSTGQGLYVPDNPLRTDSAVNHANNPSSYIPEQPLQQQQPTSALRENLLSIYFQFVDPLIPILHRPSFLQQLRAGKVNDLLLNAIYCVSSRWDLAMPSSVGEEPRGWVYYQKAVHLLDQQGEPKLSTIQAVFLLLKYNEHVRRPGFSWRTRYYFQMIVRMSKDLGLSRNIAATTDQIVDMERRKRTFWGVYCYDVMMSVENGSLPSFSNVDCSVDIPHVLQDEAQEGDKIIHFILLIKIMRTQSDIIEFLHIKHYKKMAVHWNQDKQFHKLSNELATTISLITSTAKFPQKENMCYTVCFLYLASCFATILLYRHVADQSEHCLEAALNIKTITELILECNAFEDMYCSMRGIQQIVHFLSAAVTVFKEQEAAMAYNSTLGLAQKLASISPVTEVIGSNRVKRGGESLQASVRNLQIHVQQPQQYQMTNTNASGTYQFIDQHQQQQQQQQQRQQQQQQQQQGYGSPMELVEQQSIPTQQQSLLGFLLYNEDVL